MMVDTGDAKAGQPCGGKIGADVLGEIATNDVYNRNDQQHARHIAEHKKPEQKFAAVKVAPTCPVLWVSPHLAPKKESGGRAEWTRLSGGRL